MDSLDSVWKWGFQQVGDSYARLLHRDCIREQARNLTQEIGVNTEIKGPLVASSSSLSATMRTSGFTRLAGLSGALAVALGAYGAHVLGSDPDKAHLKHTFDTANKYHLIHSAVLLAIPLARRPRLSGSLFVGGMLVFCGTTYYHALTGDTQFRSYTPYGGVMLILAWLSLIL